jgi:catechol 2,3-dioxygenase-like lactoylglutathione lyase family enzyme
MGNSGESDMAKVRMEGISLAVKDIRRSLEFYEKKLGLTLEVDALPHFAMIRVGGSRGGTIGLLSTKQPDAAAARTMTAKQRATIQVELSTDNVDALYKKLKAKGVVFHRPPHDEPWERSMQAFDPDGYTVEFAQGRRGHNKPRAESR